MSASALLDNLNGPQLIAATHTGGHALILAGAGSGKTRTIIARAAYLIETGIDAERIQILTFTRKSASEIVGRVKMQLGEKAAQLRACTFHSWCMGLIRRMPGMFGCEDHSVIDRDDQLGLFKVIRGRGGRTSLPPARQLCDIYSFARNCKITLSQSLRRFDEDLLATKDELTRVFVDYEKRKKDRRYLDYDDVLDVVATVLRDDREVRDFVASRYDHLLVDEMQDTNPLQWQLLDALREQVQLYCVGDDAQSIYGFRGADFRNVHSFIERVPGASVLKLEENYRSTQPILDLANWLLRQSPLSYDKELVAARGPGTKPKLLEMESEWDEGQWVANDILKRRADGAACNNHMVLIRSRFAGRSTEAALLSLKIPYVFVGGTSLLQSAHVRDVLSLLRLVVNFLDEIAWVRYLTLWPGVGEKTATDLIEQLLTKSRLEECIQVLSNDPRVSVAASRAIQNVASLVHSPGHAFRRATTELGEVLESNYRNDHWESRRQDFPLVEKLASNHGSILSFIEEYVLDPVYSSRLTQVQVDDCVTLITIHSAKGTECPVCYLVGVSPGAYPLARCIDDVDDVEEERRVLYVAITRARDELILTRVQRSRFVIEKRPTGMPDDKISTSYFLNDLPPELVERMLSTRYKEAVTISTTPRPRPEIGINLG